MKLLRIISILGILILIGCNQKESKTNKNNKSQSLTIQDSTKLKAYLSKAFRQNLFSQERQQFLDSALQISPDNSFLWQQKAMPLFKSKKYSVGMKFINKAVTLDSENYLDYRAFIKCIFSKNYLESIIDFEKAKALYGDSYVMDHTYNFYIGLCYLQLNEYEKANESLKLSIVNQLKKFEEDWIPFLDWFYLGISEFELQNYKEAVINLDKALIEYPTFADAQYYKVKCLARLGKIEEAEKLLKIARENIKKGNTFNEGNSIYERYPYQIYKEQLQYFRD